VKFVDVLFLRRNSEVGEPVKDTQVHYNGHSQTGESGALGGAVLAWAREQRMGFSKFVSYGNRSNVDETELLEYFLEDPQTRVIAAYIEGLRDGRRFIWVAQRVSMVKPVLAIKSGYSVEGSGATLLHTGAMAGSDKIYDGAFRQAGIIRAEDVDGLLAEGVKMLESGGVPNFPTVRRTAKALWALVWRGRHLAQRQPTAPLNSRQDKGRHTIHENFTF